MISLELNFQGFSYYGIRLSDQDFIRGVYPPDQWPVSHRIIPNEPSIGSMTVNMTVSYVLYIYMYIYIHTYLYLIWSYHITSRRHEDCILFDRFELWHASQQQCCSTALSPPDSLRRVSNFWEMRLIKKNALCLRPSSPVLHAPRLKRPPFVWDHCKRWCVLYYRRCMIFVSSK